MNANLGIVVACVATFAAAVGAQEPARFQLEGGRMGARVVPAGAKEPVALAPGAVLELPAGACDVHFGADADGKPRSLRFEAPAGARVDVAVAAAEPAEAKAIQPFDPGRDEIALERRGDAAPAHAVTIGDAAGDAASYRVSADVRRSEGTTAAGLVARYAEGQGCYVFFVDWVAEEVRLERWMGGDHLVVRRAEASGLRAAHTLTLQVDGFRLQAELDDAVVLQSFDGALRLGVAGVAWVGDRPTLDSDLRVGPVAQPRASAALVQTDDGATLYAAVTVTPGHLYALELTLDRPHRWIPRTPAGLEPWLQNPPAAPIVALADWRGSLGENALDEVPVDGLIAVQVRWPAGAALRTSAALARLLLVTPDGELVVERTPPVSIHF